MNKTWSQYAWENVTPLYNKILDLSFINELMTGTLKQEQFLHYIAQDSIYLGEYGRILAGIGAKLSKAEQRSSFLKFATDTVVVEQALHQGFKNSINKQKKTEATPACLLYTSYLHKQLATEPIEVAVAAVLPCFVVYKKVGDYILEHQSGNDNPYQDWINTYGGEDFANAVKRAEDIADELAENASAEIRERMLEAYVMATKLEWMFWHSAYELEKWPL